MKRLLVLCALLAALTITAVARADAPFAQQAELTASDGLAGDAFGTGIAVDGDTMVVGAVFRPAGPDTAMGAAYVFERGADGWKQAATLDLPAGANATIGQAAISGDTIVIGASDQKIAQNDNQGAVYVFQKPSTGWQDAKAVARLTVKGGGPNDGFGNAVAVSGDTVVASAQNQPVGDKGQQGAAYVFVKPSAGWKDATQTAQLLSSDGVTRDFFGTSVAIDGGKIVVGAPHHTVGQAKEQGAAYVYLKPSSGWQDAFENAELTAFDGNAGDQLGFGTAISGGTVVLGAPFHRAASVQSGAAYVYVEGLVGFTGPRTETAELTPSDGVTQDRFGIAVGVSGNTVVAGSFLHQVGANEAQGAAYLYRKPVGPWKSTTETQQLVATDGAKADALGDTVAISGNYVFAGAPLRTVGSNVSQGSVFAFAPPPEIAIDSPADGATFIQDDAASASFTCTAPGAATITACSGPVPSGGAIDTSVPGAHTFQVDATDSDGVSASRTVAYSVARGTGTTPPPPPPPAKPVISKLRVNAKKAIVTFRLSRAAAVKVRVAKAKPKHRFATKRRFTVHGKAGANKARIPGRRLTKGRYKVTAAPVGGAGRTAIFRIGR